MRFEKFGFQIMMAPPVTERKDGVCLALQQEEDEFYLIANVCGITFFSTEEQKPNVDILSLEEGEYKQGKWHRYRRLNGDEAASMRYDAPVLLKVKLFAYA